MSDTTVKIGERKESWKALDSNTISIKRNGQEEIYYFDTEFNEGVCIEPAITPPLKMIKQRKNRLNLSNQIKILDS